MTDTTFWGGLKVTDVRWALSEPVQTARLGDGSIVRASLGAALWQGEATLLTEFHADLAGTEARISKLMRPGESFLAYDPRYKGPRLDPGGVILGASTPTIHTLNADNRRLRVQGLPPGYVLSAGDYIGWEYGSNPTRYAMHQLVTGATANSSGLTPLFEVAPHIRPGVFAAAAVTLIEPKIKAVLVEADYGVGRALFTEGPTLKFTQVLR